VLRQQIVDRLQKTMVRVVRRAAGLSRRRYLAGGGILLLLLALGLVVDTIAGSPDARQIRTLGQMPVATVLYDRAGQPAFTVFHERRLEVPLAQISPDLVNAVVAVEDQRFYEHHGLDAWRIAGSVWADIRGGGYVQGGSTITQQLARQSFLTTDKTVRRKLKEAWLALRIERLYTKREILEIYLNKVYFGSGLYGAEAAARGYFGTPAAALTLDEAALLAGLIKGPSAYDPTEHLDRALARRGVVLGQMVSTGLIDQQTARAMGQRPVKLVNPDERTTGAWFKQAVTRELVDRFGWDLVSTGGLKVYTTYDPAAQHAAEQALTKGLTRIEAERGFRHPTRARVMASRASDADDATKPGQAAPDYLQGALVALDPDTGEVRALVGGRDFAESQFDRVSQARRQAGSAFKPFVYATALERGYSPATLITDLDRPIPTPEGPWLPDDGHNEAEAMTVRAALRVSSNRAAAQMLQKVGIEAAVDQARQMGLVAPPVPSLVLGSGDVTLMGLTAAYGAFADDGLLRKPYLVRKVVDANGKVLWEAKPESHRVLSSETSFQMAQMLADVVDHGTGVSARSTGFSLPAAGKTGTTNAYRDAWFVGFTPDLVAGVWIGFDQPKTIMPGGYASALAVPIWGTFMRDATAGDAPRWLNQPSGVVAVQICEDSGLLPNPACRRVHETGDDGSDRVQSHVGVEYFRRGSEPTAYCPIHQTSWFAGLVTADAWSASAPLSSLPRVGVLQSGEVAKVEARAPAAVTEITAASPDAKSTKKDDKRGFWSRFVGVFKGHDDESREQPRRDTDSPR
jgi:1A family penicillin-binding protein